MEIRDFSESDYPALVEIHQSLNIVWPEQPATPKAWAEVDRSQNPKYRRRRWVAVEDRKTVAFASYDQWTDQCHSDWYSVNVEVHSAHQRCGIGSRLYEHVIAALAPFEPRVLRADAFTNLPQGYAFLQKRGFHEVFRETPVHLNIPAFDPRPYAGLEPNLNAQGIVIKTVRELKADPDRDRKIYDLYWSVVQDVPHEDAEIEAPPFEEWLSWGFAGPDFLPDAFFVATHGDDYIGLRELCGFPDSGQLLGGLLAVRREYRNRGIGLAMQLRGIAYAQEHGYSLLKTCTAVHNKPMQSLFDKLGYVRDPEWQQCQKDI